MLVLSVTPTMLKAYPNSNTQLEIKQKVVKPKITATSRLFILTLMTI